MEVKLSRYRNREAIKAGSNRKAVNIELIQEGELEKIFSVLQFKYPYRYQCKSQRSYGSVYPNLDLYKKIEQNPQPDMKLLDLTDMYQPPMEYQGLVYTIFNIFVFIIRHFIYSEALSDDSDSEPSRPKKGKKRPKTRRRSQGSESDQSKKVYKR